MTWDLESDVIVVGFGAAGACAALEAAAAGARVLVLDRFGGGGATALSGGVVYAGGGTPQQQAAGVTDSAGAMFAYLSAEAGDVVSAATLRAFCDGSPAMLAWLERHGVPFEGSLCPDKTSYPTNRHYLYYSGSEQSARGGRAAGAARPPDARPGHLGPGAVRPAGRGGPRQRRHGAPADPGGAADHRRGRAGHRGGGQQPARGPAVGQDRAPGAAPLVGQALPVRPAARPVDAPAGGAGWSAGTAGRCGPARAAAWCWPRAGS